MKRIKIVNLIIYAVLFSAIDLYAQTGYHDAPYVRYEADLGTLTNATATTKSYTQSNLQSEASEQICVNLSTTGASVEWTLSAEADGLVVRYSVPDGGSGVLDVMANNVSVGTLTLTSNYSWEYLSTNGNPNNVGVVNTNPRMRFDEVRLKLPSKIAVGGTLKLVNTSGSIHIDFAELESTPAEIMASGGDVTYSGNGSNLQAFINANGGNTIYLPAGVYNVNRELYFGVNNTVLKGAGMWFTQINFTDTNPGDGGGGGLRANATDISFSGLYLTTVRNSRSNSYKAINGVFTSGSTIRNIWAEHFECGAWIGQYNVGGPAVADGFTLSDCRFRNNYADGINLCKGTSNSVVEHCSFRNNGDDDMAIWPSDGVECRNNTYRYNTSENCWRAAGCAFYGGYNNTAHHLVIKDNLEVGIRINNSFSGIGFNDGGMHEFHDITILRCGTFNDLYNNPVGAIDLSCTNIAGTRIKNLKFSNITLIDSRNDALYMTKKTGGEGFYNVVFENITVNGTGKEYPGNNAKGLNWGRGYGILIVGNPAGYGTYCNLTYSNRGGNAMSNTNYAQIGTFSFTNAGCGTYITSPASGEVLSECASSITITADASVAYGTVDKIEFFVDAAKVGEDLSFPYSYVGSNLSPGNHQLYARSTYSPSGNVILSPVQQISIAYFKGLMSTSTAPTIDGTAESLWATYTAETIEKNSVGSFTGAADLSATYQVSYDSDNLYLLVDVTDDALRNDGGNRYDNDGLELFIDIGNDKSGPYGANDFTYNFVYNDPTVYETQHNAIAGVTFAQGIKTGGYIMEISIPWSTLGTGPGLTTGALLGFDIHIDDDDNGGARDAKKAWNDCGDVAWQNTSVLGTLEESGCTAPYVQKGFVSFSASMVNGTAELDWETYYKNDDHHFEVLRAVGAGALLAFANVNASGTTGALSSKSYADVNPPAGLVSYRISRVDADGCNKIFSEIIQLSVTTGLMDAEETGINFYPNPFQSTGQLQINTGNPERYKISIKEVSGKIISEEKLTGQGPYSIGERLPSGIYLLEIFDGSTHRTVKLVKL